MKGVRKEGGWEREKRREKEGKVKIESHYIMY